MSLGKGKSSSNPLNPNQVAKYFNRLDELSGYRLGGFARGGTPDVDFRGLSTQQIRNLGGAGATRELKAQEANDQALEQIDSDPSLSVFQKQRARQLNNDSYRSSLDAIAKETEAALSQQANSDNINRFQSDQINSTRLREDMETLARIFFGGRGTSSKSRNFNVAFKPPE